MNKKRRYQIELTEEQLSLIANCVEDCHRFISGQMGMSNSASMLDTFHELENQLEELQPLVTPELPRGASYGWSGGSCPNDCQRRFIAQTYYLYREIRHRLTVDRGIDNVYSSETLLCENSGEPIKIKVVEE